MTLPIPATREERAALLRAALPVLVGNEVRVNREKRALTQAQLGKLCGMAQSAIARIENGRGLPSISTLTRIAHALDCALIMRFTSWEECIQWLSEAPVPVASFADDRALREGRE